MHKKLAALLCILLCLALLGGCGGKATAPADGPTAETTGAVTTTAETTTQETTTSETTTSEAVPASTTRTRAQTPPGQKFATPGAGANDFAFRLSKALLKNNGSKNFLSSPYSVWLPLAALVNATDAADKQALLNALGASGYSEKELNEAAARMLSTLTNRELRERRPEYNNALQIANALFVDKHAALQPSFQKTFADYYQGSFQSVDFASPGAVKAVNDWASQNTQGLIKEIVDKFEPGTAAAIANAIYFYDQWMTGFNPELTEKGAFHGARGDADAFFMLREGSGMDYYEDDKLQAVLLPFKTTGGMYILLPKDGNAVSLLSSMTPAYFGGIQNGSILSKGKLLLPRFSIDSGVMDLEDALRALGVPLFEPGSLPGLIREDSLYVSEAVQRAAIEVDEKGTTAAAVTGMTLLRGIATQPYTEPFSMVCDRPFAFVLYGEGQILFTGVVNQI